MTTPAQLEAIEQRLQERFPGLSVAPARLLATGFGSVVVETGDGVVFRIARHADTAEGHAREMRLLPALQSTLPLSVPNPEWTIPSGVPGLPYGAIGYRKLPGEPLSSESVAEGVAEILASFLLALHSFPIARARELGLADVRNAAQQFQVLSGTVLPVLRGALAPRELETVRRWAEGFAADPIVESFAPAVRHGDFWYGNILVDASGNPSAVLDWENAAVADPAADLARQRHLGDRFADQVLEAYRPARDDPTLEYRVRRHWELLEFAGVRSALALDDSTELEETIAKLRAGPILS